MASIDSNGPLRVAHTTISGNALTRSETIERHLQGVYEADTIGTVAHELLQASQALEQLGVFEHVDLVMQPSSLPGHANLQVNVKEKRVMSLKATTFLEQGEGGVEISARALNALGSAESLEVSALLGGSDVKADTPKHSVLQVLYTHPNPYNTAAVVTASADASSQRPLGAPYEEVSYGTQIKVRRGLLEFDWTARQRDICPLRKSAEFTYQVPENVLAACRPSLKSSIGAQINISQFLPNMFVPQVGVRNFLRMDFAHPTLTGGNVNVMALTAKTSQVQQLTPDGLSLVTSLEASTCRTSNPDGFLHLQDRLYLGGPMFLRGFNPRGINSLGGRNRWQCRVALEGPPPTAFLIGNNSDVVRGHAFVCAGALSNETSVKSLLVDELRVSCGLGLAFGIGMGRIEANFMYVLKTNPKDALSGRLQFGIGADFL